LKEPFSGPREPEPGTGQVLSEKLWNERHQMGRGT
jgi:hypothetical protein